ncbi:MAG TPA: hypothetical protein DET40_00520 [Lentisphaeria bacterium]|nr:MAG: hypothetical protein A2X45_05145 [Lentisphaerae bacterium GWF2_50_93]HCE42017.1 hypothetical protein [Lentisphaeria bacterium]
MQAVEFEADVKGKTIKVPDMLSGLADKHVKIILLFNDSPAKAKSPRRKFSAVGINTKNFKFNRAELYER